MRFLGIDLRWGNLRHHWLGGHYTLANIDENTLFFHVESNVRRSSIGFRSTSVRSDRFLARSQARHRSNALDGWKRNTEHPTVAHRFPSQAGTMPSRSQSQSQCQPTSSATPSANDDLSTNNGSFTHVLSSFFVSSMRSSFSSRTRHRHWSILLEFRRHSEYSPWLRFRQWQDGQNRRFLFIVGRHRCRDNGRSFVSSSGACVHSRLWFPLGIHKVSIDDNPKMPRLIISIDQDPRPVSEDLQRNGKVNARWTSPPSESFVYDDHQQSRVYSLEFLQAIDRMSKEEWLPRMRSVAIVRVTARTFFRLSTSCHILQSNEDEINTLDDGTNWLSEEISLGLSFVFSWSLISNRWTSMTRINLAIVEWRSTWNWKSFAHSQSRWGWTLDSIFAAIRLREEHFRTAMFNVNRLVYLSEWWTESNGQKTQLGLMKNVTVRCERDSGWRETSAS